jgi:clan AA aspartic protease (TIGR02281 family)
MKRIVLGFILFLIFFSISHSQIRIKMKMENGVYTTPFTVNGLRLRFIFDTGATNVSISLSEALFMLKNGYLDETDIHGSSFSQIASGELIENTTVNLKEMEIGGIKIFNIEAIIVHNLSAPLLLGQSAISKLGKIQLQDDNLIIFSLNNISNDDACIEARKLISDANKYNSDKSYALSANTYQKAYDLCPDAFDCWSTYLMGNSYFDCENYTQSIKYLEKSIDCAKNENNWLYWNYNMLGESYMEIGDYTNSILYIQKSLFYANTDKNKSFCYSLLGQIYSKQKKYSDAIKNYELRIDHYLKSLGVTNIDVLSGKVKNPILGEIYWNINVCYGKLNYNSKADHYAMKAALCGNEPAIEFCAKYNLRYDLLSE